MKKVVEILMRRDGMTREEATDLVQETIDEIMNCDPMDADEIMMTNLGLEPDYLMDIF